MPSTLLFCLRHVKAKRVLTFHHGIDEDVKRSPYKKIKDTIMLKLLLNSMDVVTTVSDWHANYCTKQYGVDVKMITNGVDTNIFKPIETLIPKENAVLFVGRFAEQKGVANLIEAARCLPEYEFWFVGSGPLKNLLTGSNIKCLGFVDDIVKCYNKALICVWPSKWENFPLVGLEAMSCGKPIIATELGFSEYIEDGIDGILIKNNSVDQIVDAIQLLMEDKNLINKLSKNARKKALKYDWHKITREYYRLYETLIK